jgi:hypothetical protein
LTRLAGGLLVLAGVYIVAFWVVELAGITGGPVSAVVPLVERGSSLFTNLIGDHPVIWGAAFAAIVTASAVASLRARQRPQPGTTAAAPHVERRER